ncbi:MAG: phage tail tip lysozyme [Gaiellaceae bacterium]
MGDTGDAKPRPQKHPAQPRTRRELAISHSDSADAKRHPPDKRHSPDFFGRVAKEIEGTISRVSAAVLRAAAPHPLADAHAKNSPKQWRSSKGREQYASTYFAATLRLNRFQAAAIVGNLAVESYAYQSPGKPRLKANLGQYGGGGGYGIAQWTLPERKEALQDFAKQHGLSHANFGLQLAYAAHELATDGESKKYGRLIAKGTIEALRNAKSPAEAVAIVQVGFEHPGGQDGKDWRRVPPFPSVRQLAKQFPQPNALLPVTRTGKDAATYYQRFHAATKIARGRPA